MTAYLLFQGFRDSLTESYAQLTYMCPQPGEKDEDVSLARFVACAHVHRVFLAHWMAKYGWGGQTIEIELPDEDYPEVPYLTDGYRGGNHLAVFGNLFEGMRLHGPFQTAEAADEYGKWKVATRDFSSFFEDTIERKFACTIEIELLDVSYEYPGPSYSER